MSAIKTLNEVFGYEQFRSGQGEVVQSLLDGSSTLAIFPTGAGKSICYQVPALMLEGLTLVVSPLMALMKDQVEFLKNKGVDAAKLDSSLTQDEYKEVIGKIRSRNLKVLFVSPERFNNEFFRSLLLEIDISLFVIDEAHCISEWGHNFRPDYLKLAKYAKTFNAQRVLCLTATANEGVEKDIVKKFNIKESSCFRRSAYRKNLNLNVLHVDSHLRNSKLVDLLTEKKNEASIIYVTLQKTAEEVTNFLKENGIEANFYHAGLDSEVREDIQNKFMSSELNVIVATIAFGMGIDKSNIRNVIHYNLPKSIENYYQEIGRAGRDGKKSDCYLLLSEEDIPTLETFAIGDFPEKDLVEKLLIDILEQDEKFALKLTGFANSHDMKQIVVKTILTQLELKGHIEELTPVYSKASFKYLKTKTEIVNLFPSEKRDFLKTFLSYGDEKKIWTYIEIDKVIEKMGIDRKKVIDVLDFLDQKSLIELKMSNLINQFRFLDKKKSLSEKESLIEDVCQTTDSHLEKQLNRITDLIGFFTNEKCIHNSIASYFETPLEGSCGHCSFCISGAGIVLKDYVDKEVSFNINDVLSDLNGHQHIIMSHSRVSKYLLGIKTPYMTKNKLTKTKSFSSLNGTSWARVFNFVQTNL